MTADTKSSNQLAALVPTHTARPRSLLRAALHRTLRAMTEGRLEIRDADGVSVFGKAGEEAPGGSVTVHDPRFYTRVALGGTLGAAESYVDGDWDANDLVSVNRAVLRNRAVLGGLDSGLQRVGAAVARIRHVLNRNTIAGSRRNIRAHYDVGNDFFERMLDPSMTYSSGYFDRPDATLEEASRAKISRIAGKVAAAPGDDVLEIGTGWGALSMHLASEGARVTTTTLSREQARLARERIEQARLADRVTVVEQDYRELSGRYDKLVSVEMIEAVGAEHFGTFFRQCGALVRDGGTMVLQAITIEDQAFASHVDDVDFIKRHVFPGCCIPSVTELLKAATESSRWRLTHLEDMGPHYARTIACWRENLAPHEGWVVARYGRAFWRSWMFYLAYCQAGFEERYLSVAQMVFEQPRWRVQ